MDKQPGPAVYSTGSYIKYPAINHIGKEYNNYVYGWITESLCCTPETNHPNIVHWLSVTEKVTVYSSSQFLPILLDWMLHDSESLNKTSKILKFTGINFKQD